MPIEKKVLPFIVLAQFCCTSLWFAGNGVMNSLLLTFELEPESLGHLTAAVQFGFIVGTLFFAYLSLADRFSPSKVFFYCAIFGAFVNLGILLEGNSIGRLLLFRFLTGFSLAGIYPVGMKIASDYYQKGLGISLGFLVGALVLGTAFPHLLNVFTGTGVLPWRLVIVITSILATLGGLIVFLLVPDGPYRKTMLKMDFSAFFKVFRIPEFKAAALGYFGHMWELYAFWSFVPVVLSGYQLLHSSTALNIPLHSFLIIGLGSVACVTGGFISQKIGTRKTAATVLFLSGLCCVVSPLIMLQSSGSLLILFLTFWGLVVVADSPLFSTLVAQKAPASVRGTALTIVNSLGFAITIVSIQLINLLLDILGEVYILMLLAPGPALGLYGFLRRSRKATRMKFKNS